MSDSLRQLDPLLIPRPWRIVRTDGWIDAPSDVSLGRATSQIKIDLAHRGREEGYSISIREPGPNEPSVHIVARGPRGIAHAFATLDQIHRQYGDRWPTMEIDDAPAFATRGVMLDISRTRIPTMQSFMEIIRGLAALKFNHLQLYTEHTFAYSGHADVWRGWSAMTPDELDRLDAFAASHGIELAPNQNCFGHLAEWFKHPAYAPLAEAHGEWSFDGWPRRGPFSLCPIDPRSIELVRDWLGQLSPHFRHSNLINIGCDETYDIGHGRSRGAVERRGKGEVYLEHLARVVAEARRLGRRSMFWADVALSHPEVLERLPRDVIGLVWGYEPDSPFDAGCRHLSESRHERWVCPGTSSWCSVTGRTSERRANQHAAALAGQRHGASGYLVCDWGDHGHWQPWPVALNAIAHAADCAWTGRGRTIGESDHRAVSLHALGDRSLTAGSWLDDLGDVDAELRAECLGLARPGRTGRLQNQSALFADLRTPTNDALEIGSLSLWHEAKSRVEALSSTLSQHANWPRVLRDEAAHAAAMASWMADRAVKRRSAQLALSADRRTMMDRLLNVRATHRRLWLPRHRAGGLDASCAYFDPLIKELSA
jgi:hexosaminidase